MIVAGLEAAEDVELLVVVLDLRAGRGALEAREDRLVDVRRCAAPGEIVEVAEAEAVGVEREEREAEARPSRFAEFVL